MPSPYKEEHDRYLDNYRKTGIKKIIGIGQEAIGLQKNGSTFPLYLSVSEFHINEKKMFTGIVHDLTNQKATERKLIQAKELAESANIEKSRFLTNMSHELRTPMHGILSFTQLGIKNVDKGDTEKLARYFDRINISGKRLLNLLNDLLDLSKLESGQMEIHRKKENLWLIIETCVADQEAWLQRRNISVIMEDIDKQVIAEFDAVRIIQVITNLLSNAIKFSLEEHNITLSCKKTDFQFQPETKYIPALLFSIQDEGVGIPEDELLTVFDKFIQSSKTRTDAGGTGLGLAICKEIIEAHQGMIWASVAEKLEGSIFTFVIPISVSTESK